MSQPPGQPDARPTDPADGPATPGLIARLLDEIRRDPGWRAEVASLRRPAEPTAAPARPSAPPLDPSLRTIVAGLAEAVEQPWSDWVADPGRSSAYQAWFRARQLVRARVWPGRARQAVVNGAVASALQRVALMLDPSDSDSALGALWAELVRLEARVGELDRRLARLEGGGGASRLDAVEETARALSLEVEPLGALRATVDELERRLARLEGAP